MADASPVDTEIISLSEDNLTIEIFTTEISKIGSYELILQAQSIADPSVSDTLAFVIEVKDPCQGA